MVYAVPVKGIAALHACKAHVLHAHYTQCPHSVYASYTQMPKNACNYTHIYIESSIIYYTWDCNTLFGFSEFADNFCGILLTALPFAMSSKVNFFPRVVQIVFSNL